VISKNALYTKSGLLVTDFEREFNDKQLKLFVLTNKNGLEATISNFGLRMVSLMIPDAEGILRDVILGHRTIDEYLYPKNEFCMGAVIGRYANRIANGKFMLEGEPIFLEKNNGNNHLHGGSNGYHRVVWDAYQLSQSEVKFSYYSTHMEAGYPGNLQITATYRLHDDNTFETLYTAITDKTTVVNLTAHPYFNLAGEGNDLSEHFFRINADYFTPVTSNHVPNGEPVAVKETPFDFTQEKSVLADIDANDQQLQFGNGYDHNFVLNTQPSTEEGLVLAASVRDANSKIEMDIYTSKPGIQFYTANFLDGSTKGKEGQPHQKRTGFCLETQYFPDSPNQPDFPSPILKPNKNYMAKTVYKFSVSS